MRFKLAFSALSSFHVVIVLLTAPFSQAHAATAWVVWEHSNRYGGHIGGDPELLSDDWELGEAFPDYQLCMNLISEKVNSARKSFEATCVVGEGKVIHSRISDEKTKFYGFCKYPSGVFQTRTSDYYCYPDTIDPRKK